MSQLGIVKYSYLAYFSQPASDRAIYRELKQQRVERIVELGVGQGLRAQRMIAMAAGQQPQTRIQYTGIDLFEARPASCAGLTLKQAYKLLRELPADVRLIPGDPYQALMRAANDLPGTDLLVVAIDQDPEALARAWALVPRMLHPQSLVFREQVQGGERDFQQLAPAQVEALAVRRRRRPAA